MVNQDAKENVVKPYYQDTKWYPVKTPWILKKLYPSYTWEIDTREKTIYLTFDDGPHPIATPFVLDELKKFQASATFFCIGKNVMNHEDIFKRILEEGHSIGNHTHRHLNGWNTKDAIYLNDVAEAAKYLDTELFRPPYGRIGVFQAKNLHYALNRASAKIIMWSVLSGDFDPTITGEKCLQNVVLNAGPGSIVVFHDSEKAFPLLQFCLPRVLEFYVKKGYQFKKL